jgi:hypothetical protein
VEVVRLRLRGANGEWTLTPGEAAVLVREIRKLVARPELTCTADVAAYALQLAIDAIPFEAAVRPVVLEDRHRPVVLLALDALEAQGRLTPSLSTVRNALHA